MSKETGETGREGAAAGDALLGRLEALAARLEAQSALIQQQSERIAAQDAVIARLTSTAPAVAAVQTVASTVQPKLGRRNLLTKALAATAAAAVLTVAKEPQRADATASFTAWGPSTDDYGLLAYPGASGAPISPLRNGHHFGVIGSTGSQIGPPSGAGVYGAAGSDGRIGVLGLSDNGAGVWGQSVSFFGVRGESTSHVGVGGISNTDWGVWGRSQTNQAIRGESVSGTGVYGTSTSGVGVFGISNSPSNAPKEGVRGESIHGPGVWGKSTNHAGVYSQGGGGNIALFGITATGTALAAQATTPAGQAGLFLGNVNIIGNLTVSGSFPKSAGVPHPDGSTRRMYCMEGPESAFEDWGRGQLQGGKADIKLDPEFAALVTADDYSVFLQPEGPTALYVSQRTATGFEVREVEESGLGTTVVPGRERSVRPTPAGGAVTFSYRVLAKRKDLVGKTRRMERVELPRGVRRGGERGIMADTALLAPPADGPAPESSDQHDRSEPHPGGR